MRSNSTGKSSHLLIYPYVWTPWGSPDEFVTECHHNSSIPYVPGNVFVSIRTKGFWCNTLILAVVPVHNRKSSNFLVQPYARTPWGSSRPFVTECHHNSSIPYVPGNVLVGIRIKGFWCNTLILAVVPVHNRKSSNFLVQPYARTPWGSSRPFVTECHHNSSIPYVPGNVLVGIRIKGFWCNTLILAVVPVHNRKSSNFLVQPYARTPWGSSRPFVTECHDNSSIPYVPGNVLVGIRIKGFWCNTLI